MTDWLDLTKAKNLVVEMVSPNDIDEVIGTLDGVERSASNLECGYYTDTRTSGALTVVGDSYQESAFLRPVIEIPEIDYRRELGLYLVWRDQPRKSQSKWVHDLELQSMLFGMSVNVPGRPWVIAANAKAMTAARQMLERCKRPYVTSGSVDYVFKQAQAFDADTDWLTRLYELTNVSGNRIDVDGHGRVTIAKSVSGDERAPSMTLELSDPRGVIQSIGMSSSRPRTVGRVVVCCRYSEEVNGNTTEKEVYGQADADNSLSLGVRGYLVSEYYEVPDMTPKTTSRANQIAKERLGRFASDIVEWEIHTPYLPLWEGDVIELVVSDGFGRYTGTRKCLVKSVTFDNLLYFGMTITLKETASGDMEEE